MILRALATVALAAASATAGAEVLAVGPGGFHVKLERSTTASPDEAWQTLLAVGRWWSSEHTYSGRAANMTIEPRAGGCFCERWEGGEVEHLRVSYVSPAGRQLLMTGGLGPLLWQGAGGALAIVLEPAEGGTQLRWEYRVSGFDPKGWEAMAPVVDAVLAEQLDRLVALLASEP